MKRTLLFALLWAVFCLSCRAQYVTIPDAVFVTWLSTHGYAGCLSGNQLDTTCTTVLNATSMQCSATPIRNLSGIQYFKNLKSLDCSNDSLYTIPALPPNLIHFYCNYNNLTSLPPIPATDTGLHCDRNQLTSLPTLPAALRRLDCSWNNLTSLPALPPLLHTLFCYSNQITALPAFPSSLKVLGCSHNPLGGAFPALPSGMNRLYCASCQLTSLPALPNLINTLDCCFNPGIHTLPTLPLNLEFIDCRGDSLSLLPSLPLKLKHISCGYNQITSLPLLPDSLKSLSTDYDPLDSLPPLPLSLNDLFVQGGHLRWLPALPPKLVKLDCFINDLTEIPPLPDSMYYLRLSINPNLRCLPELKRINTLLFANTAVTCLPNYGVVSSSTPALSSLPLCGIYNPNGCSTYWNISGTTYYDGNNNCSLDGSDVGTGFVKMKLDSAGVLVQQTFSGGEGNYSFKTKNGLYKLTADTTNLPFTVSCPDSGYLNTLITTADSLSYSNNFGFKCRTVGYDVGVQSIVNNYLTPRPSDTVVINTVAGDISQLYGAHCATGISGQVQLTFSGPAIYVGPDSGALAPNNVNGTTLTWNIVDFGAVDIFDAFNIRLRINNAAQAGDHICFTVAVSPTANDYRPSNNTLTYCFVVVNALDPNDKQVYPIDDIDTTQQWLTYTVRFQNVGTAAALHVRINDTLDNHLDPSSFQLLAFSHENLTQLFGRAVVFNFPNINLPDSGSNESASHGFVQYRVRTNGILAVGDSITNSASIYFDLNSAVVTNTVVNHVVTGPTCIASTYNYARAACSGDTVFVGTHAYTQAGNYIDTLVGANGCDSIVTTAVTIHALPQVSLSWDSMVMSGVLFPRYPGTGDTVLCIAFSHGVVLKGGTPAGGIYTGIGIANNQFVLDSFFTAPLPEYDTITYTYADNNGCQQSASNRLYLTACADIDETDMLNSVLLYPNPADDEVLIDFDPALAGTYVILKDITGRELLQTRIATSPHRLATDKLPAGVYVVMLNTGKQTVAKLLMKK